VQAKVSKVKGLVGKVIIAHAWFVSAFEMGGWEDNTVSAHWGFLVGDFCLGAWTYSIWLLLKRLLISTVLNTVDGALNAVLSVAIQFVDTGLLLYAQPYVDRRTAFSESFGAITNLLVMMCMCTRENKRPRRYRQNHQHMCLQCVLLALRCRPRVGADPASLQGYLAISIPVIAGLDVELPSYLGDLTSMLLASIATVVSAVFALASPLVMLVNVLFKLGSKVAEWFGCVAPAGVSAVVQGTKDEVAGNTQDEIQAYLEEAYDPGESEEALDGDTLENIKGDTEVLSASTVVAGVATAAALSGIAATAVGNQDAAHALGDQAVSRHVDIQVKLGLDFDAIGQFSSLQRAELERTLARDLSYASALPSVSFCIQKMSRGSIIVDIQIHPDPSGSGPIPSDAAMDLERQAMNPSSLLRRGVLTCYTEAIVIVPSHSQQPAPGSAIQQVSAAGNGTFCPARPWFKTAIGIAITPLPPYRVLQVHDLVDKNFVRYDEPEYLNPEITAGDRLVNVNGRWIENLDHQTIVSMFQGPLHSTVTLTLARVDSGLIYEVEAMYHVQHSFATHIKPLRGVLHGTGSAPRQDQVLLIEGV
jgi:hypothetical protein